MTAQSTRWLLPLPGGGILCRSFSAAADEALRRPDAEPGGIRQISGRGCIVLIIRRGGHDVVTGLHPSIEAAREVAMQHGCRAVDGELEAPDDVEFELYEANEM